jgi:16S rRNA (uracil1498-N3)-methyltransferase
MHRLYSDQKVQGETITISDPSRLHYLRDVLRLKPGDHLTIFDSNGKEYLAAIRESDKKGISLSILKQLPVKSSPIKIAVACAIPKGSRMDEIVDKLTQLGVDVIIPMITERVVVKVEASEEAKFERWRKVALSAVEQSHRTSFPIITNVMAVDEVLAKSKEYDIKLIPTLTGDRKSLKEVISRINPKSILALIGPEGDFSPTEIEAALRHGFVPITLGDSILRVETAAVAIASFLRFTLASNY